MCCFELSKNFKCVFLWIGGIVVVLVAIIGFVLILRDNKTVKDAVYTAKKGVDDGHSPSQFNTFIINSLYWISTTGTPQNISTPVNEVKNLTNNLQSFKKLIDYFYLFFIIFFIYFF